MADSPARKNHSPIRNRLLGRASTIADMSNPLNVRRSSSLSESVESTRQSIKSSTDNLFLPKATSPDLKTNHEPSHWHSAPLALALLPAVGGVFFHNGSAVVTDLTLLGLAAVFLNWSVRLPWDWYISAQSVQVKAPPSNDGYSSETIIEEGSEEDGQQSPPTSPREKGNDGPTSPSQPSTSQSSASSELRIHELLALLMCFLFPAGGAWLLHHIRAQLTRPSEGLVSNYNLTIFLLAAELRPLSHLVKLIQARTLHLQRTVSTNAYPGTPINNMSPSSINDLQDRLAEIEKHIANAKTNGVNGTATKSPSNPDLVTQVRKTLQPDLDALNRAVRRYEKRSTLLALQTESRLQDLERRLGDAITLAAAAERSSQQQKGGVVMNLLDSAGAIISLPIRGFWALLTWPWRAIVSMAGSVAAGADGWVGRKVRREMKTAGGAEKEKRGGGSGSEKRRVQGRAAGKKVA